MRSRLATLAALLPLSSDALLISTAALSRPTRTSEYSWAGALVNRDIEHDDADAHPPLPRMEVCRARCAPATNLTRVCRIHLRGRHEFNPPLPYSRGVASSPRTQLVDMQLLDMELYDRECSMMEDWHERLLSDHGAFAGDDEDVMHFEDDTLAGSAFIRS